jgi:predicted nucleic acid-binding protein
VLYLDACALVKRYVDEGDDGTVVMDSVMDDPGRWGGLMSSEWLVLEVTSALAKKRRARLLRESSYRHLLGRFKIDVEGLSLVAISSDVVRAASGLMESLSATGRFHSGDAIHLYTALEAARGMAGSTPLVFVTADSGLESTARGAGLRVFDPRRGAIDRLDRLFGR